MSAERFSVDTNVLVYSIDTDAGERHEVACQFLDSLADRDCILTLQALAEFLHANHGDALLFSPFSSPLMTQGEDLDDLKDNLQGIYATLHSGELAVVRRVGELAVA